MKNLTIKNVTFRKPRHVWDILASFYQITGKPLKKKKKINFFRTPEQTTFNNKNVTVKNFQKIEWTEPSFCQFLREPATGCQEFGFNLESYSWLFSQLENATCFI